MFSYLSFAILITFVETENVANYENFKKVYIEPAPSDLPNPELSSSPNDAKIHFENRQILDNPGGPKSKIITKKHLSTTTISIPKVGESTPGKQLKKNITVATKNNKSLAATSKISTSIEVTSITNIKPKKKKTTFQVVSKSSSSVDVPSSTIDSKLTVPKTVPTASKSSKFNKQNGTSTTALVLTNSATEITSIVITKLIKGTTSSGTATAASTTTEKISPGATTMTSKTSYFPTSTASVTKLSETSTASTLRETATTQVSTPRSSTGQVTTSYIPTSTSSTSTATSTTKRFPTSTSEEPRSAVTKLVFTPVGKIYMRKPTCSRSIHRVLFSKKLMAIVTMLTICIMT